MTAIVREIKEKKRSSVIIMDSDHVILSAVQPETVANRVDNEEDEQEDMEDDE